MSKQKEAPQELAVEAQNDFPPIKRVRFRGEGAKLGPLVLQSIEVDEGGLKERSSQSATHKLVPFIHWHPFGVQTQFNGAKFLVPFNAISSIEHKG